MAAVESAREKRDGAAMDRASFDQMLKELSATARAANVFGDVSIADGRLSCEAKEAAEPAFYRVDLDAEGLVWVSLVTADRWLSESIEATLMHTGDKMEELLDEELVDQGFDNGPLPIQHFRSDDMLFTFRSAVPTSVLSAEAVGRVLLAYAACFDELGDMSGGEDDG